MLETNENPNTQVNEQARLLAIRFEQQQLVQERIRIRVEQIRNMDPQRFQQINNAIERSGEAYWQQRQSNPNLN